MKRIISNDYVTMLLRLYFGGLFIYASLDKIASPEQFARIVFNFHILPGSLVNIFALILPFTELVAGVGVIIGFLYRGSRDYLMLLTVVFIVAIGINVVRGVNLECGCFTVSSGAKSAGLQLIVRDLLYLAPGLFLLASRSRRWMLDRLFF